MTDWRDPPVPRLGGDFAAEVATAAEMFRGIDPVVLYSGGIDSEFVVLSLLAQAVSFTPLIVELPNHANDHDTAHAHALCDAYSLDRIVVRLPDTFFTREINDYADLTGSPALSLLVLCWAADQTDRFVITGNGDPLWLDGALVEPELYYTFHRFCALTRRPSCPAFFQASTRLYSAFAARLGAGESKHSVYATLQPRIAPRPKYTGYEAIPDLRRDTVLRLGQRLGRSDRLYPDGVYGPALFHHYDKQTHEFLHTTRRG